MKLVLSTLPILLYNISILPTSVTTVTYLPPNPYFQDLLLSFLRIIHLRKSTSLFQEKKSLYAQCLLAS